MVMYYRLVRDAKLSGPLREAIRGGFVVENVFLDSPEGQKANVAYKLRIGDLIKRMGVNDIQVKYGETCYILSEGVLKEVNGKDVITINFGDTPLKYLSSNPHTVDFVPENLRELEEELQKPVYSISYEVRAAIDMGAARSNPLFTVEDIAKMEEHIKFNPQWALRFPHIRIDILTGDVTRRNYGEDIYHRFSRQRYSKKEIKDMLHDRNAKLEIKRVSRLPFGIKGRYEVTVLEPVKTSVYVYSNLDGSFLEVEDDAIDNPNVANALDAVVEHLFTRSIIPSNHQMAAQITKR